MPVLFYRNLCNLLFVRFFGFLLLKLVFYLNSWERISFLCRLYFKNEFLLKNLFQIHLYFWIWMCYYYNFFHRQRNDRCLLVFGLLFFIVMWDITVFLFGHFCYIPLRLFLVFKDFINTKNTLQQMKLVQCELSLSSVYTYLLSCHTVTKMIIQFVVCQKIFK